MQFRKYVIGRAERLIDIIPPKSNQEPRRHIHFKVEGGRHEIVILCGEHAENFDAEGHHPATSKDSIIQLLFLARHNGFPFFRSDSFQKYLYVVLTRQHTNF
ncbi:uncharacterized protein LOC124648156 [Lolium rigidum]|uniref:uncharacterized protein LOC124648156 n=1 Tax=Lolium rigidum TaxID=89674 RepID=UPI001F5C8895|nr:uncharacterized protein LOC124648156 [Lolium rigidum]